jgi:hypothetical protein
MIGRDAWPSHLMFTVQSPNPLPARVRSSRMESYPVLRLRRLDFCHHSGVRNTAAEAVGAIVDALVAELGADSGGPVKAT